MNKCIVLLLCIMLLLSACSQQTVDLREKEVVQLVVNKKYNEAISKAKELYSGEELDEMLGWIKEHTERWEEHQDDISKSLNPSSKLEIQSGFTHRIDGNYIYVTGRVRNVSDSDISYFEVRIDFKDNNGNILNSDYTNDGLLLKPNDMREFEIMSKWDNDYDQYELSIGDIK